jgi:hypothetical protein
MIPWKAYWTTVGAVIAATIYGLTLWFTPLTTPKLVWLGDLVAVLLCAVVMMLAPTVIESAEMFRGSTDWQRRRMWFGTSLAAVAFTAWTVAAVHAGPEPVSVSIAGAGLLLLSLVVYAAARGLEWLLAARPGPQFRHRSLLVGPAGGGQRREPVRRGPDGELVAALVRAGLPWLRVLGHTSLPNESGQVFNVVHPSKEAISEYIARARAQAKREGRDSRGNAGVLSSIGEDTSEQIAIALSEITGRPILSEFVRVTKKPNAGHLSVTVLKKDLMNRVIPYVDPVDAVTGRPAVTSGSEPVKIGYGIDDVEHGLRMDRHGRLIGMSRAGKSALLHIAFAHYTRAEDTILWVGGRQKVYDLVAGWLEPYEDTGVKPPLDWVVNGQEDTLAMMVAAMNVARWRMAQPMKSRKWRKLLVVIDEFSYVATDATTLVEFDGQMVTGSYLAASLTRAAAGAEVYLICASQHSTNNDFGAYGTSILQNFRWSIAMECTDFAEIGRLGGNYKLPVPKNAGEFWLFRADAEPLNLKAAYIQSADPTADQLVDVKLTDVALSRSVFNRPGLTESEGLAGAGQAYAERPILVDGDYMAYIRAVDGITGDTPDVAVPDAGTPATRPVAGGGGAAQLGYDALDALLTSSAPAVSTPAAPAATHVPRTRRLAELLTEAGPDGLSIAAAVEALRADGDDASAASVGAELSRMRKNGRAERVEDGLYTAPNTGANQHPTPAVVGG